MYAFYQIQDAYKNCFSNMFCIAVTFSSFKNSNDKNIKHLNIIPQVTKALFILFSIFFFSCFVQTWSISIVLHQIYYLFPLSSPFYFELIQYFYFSNIGLFSVLILLFAFVLQFLFLRIHFKSAHVYLIKLDNNFFRLLCGNSYICVILGLSSVDFLFP